MRATTAVMAVVGVFGVFAASTPARADWDDYDGGWRRVSGGSINSREHQWQEQRWHEREQRERAWRAYAPPPIAYAPPSYYAPPPAYGASPPAYYAPSPARLLRAAPEGRFSKPLASRSGLVSAVSFQSLCPTWVHADMCRVEGG